MRKRKADELSNANNCLVKMTSYIRRIVGNLQEPMKKMIEPVLENIKNGYYQLLIGDDASGRIPTLIARNFINKIYQQNSHPKISTQFIAGSTIKCKDWDSKNPFSIFNEYLSNSTIESLVIRKEEKITKYLKKLKEASPVNILNALVITDFIESGFGLVPLTKAIHENNINSTILTVRCAAYHGLKKKKKKLEERLSGKVFIGKKGDSPSGIYNKEKISGITKYFSDLHSTPVRTSLSNNEGKKVLTKMTIARGEANKIAEHLIYELL